MSENLIVKVALCVKPCAEKKQTAIQHIEKNLVFMTIIDLKMK